MSRKAYRRKSTDVYTIEKITPEDVTARKLVLCDEGIVTVKTLRYRDDQLIKFGPRDIPSGAIAYVTGRKVREGSYDFVPVVFCKPGQ